MAHLNEDLVFIREPSYVQAAFTGGAARRMLLPACIELYKFTAYDVIPNRAGADYSPWWAAVEPLPGTSDPGFDGHIAAARAAGVPMVEYVRETFAVMLGWNALGVPQLGMARAVRIALAEPTYGFGGICQRMHETVPAGRVKGSLSSSESPLAPPKFMGGAYQLYIPNLKARHVRPLGTHLIG